MKKKNQILNKELKNFGTNLYSLSSGEVFSYKENAELQSFYSSIRGFIDNIFREESVYITTIFLNLDQEGKPFARYFFPKALRSLSPDHSYQSALDYLEFQHIPLSNGEARDTDIYDQLSIYRIAYLFPKNELKFGEDPLEIESLPDYFSPDIKIYPFEDLIESPFELPIFQAAERILVENLLKKFDLQNRYYFPLPIFALGKLVGVAYFIYDDSQFQQEGISNLYAYRKLLAPILTREYERLLFRRRQFAPGLLPEDPLEGYQDIFYDLNIDYRFHSSAQHSLRKGIITGNDLLVDLGYEKYYKNYAEVLINEGKDLVRMEKARMKSSIKAIIADSYAHNVAAHSLVPLKWWFERRAQLMRKVFTLKDGNKNTSLEAIELATQLKLDGAQFLTEEKLEFYQDMDVLSGSNFYDQSSLTQIWMEQGHHLPLDLLTYTGKEKDWNTGEVREIPQLAHLPFPVDYALHPYFEFLRDKSTYWSGATREVMFSGQIRGLFQLMRNFVSNPLFLGTIAHSEGINYVKIKIEFLGHTGKIELAGDFCEVDLRGIKEVGIKGGNTHGFDFLRPGKDYKVLKEKLHDLDMVFLPGGVIGQQAIYTIWENTLRDIKHYKYEPKYIQKEGLNLFISIQEVPFVKSNGERTSELPLYKIGAWLHHPQRLLMGHRDKDSPGSNPFLVSVLKYQNDHLQSRIYNENGKAKLAGTSLDKVNAALLLNNNFDSADDRSSFANKDQYFPYSFPSTEPYSLESAERKIGYLPKDSFLHPLFYPGNLPVEEKLNSYQKEMENYPNKDEDGNPLGLVKRFFHIWKGENCKVINSREEILNQGEENIARYKIVAIGKDLRQAMDYDEIILNLREQGIIRYISTDSKIEDLLQAVKQSPSDDESPLFKYAINQWLGSWLPKPEQYAVKFHLELVKDKTPLCRVLLSQKNDRWEINYLDQGKALSSTRTSPEYLGSSVKKLKLNLVHHTAYENNDKSICNVRSHCSLLNHIYPVGTELQAISSVPGPKVRVAKLMETLFTRITIFDNRIHGLLPMYEHIEASATDPEAFLVHEDFQKYEAQLNLEVYPELGKFFGQLAPRKKILENSHFLIMHLQYLTKIWEEYWKKSPGKGQEKLKKKVFYRENEVQQFFDKEIRQFYIENIGPIFPQNLILVITSGRGRDNWFENIEHPQITFRPIEAFVKAIEDGRSLGDDYQIKHNLCNLLYGS